MNFQHVIYSFILCLLSEWHCLLFDRFFVHIGLFPIFILSYYILLFDFYNIFILFYIDLINYFNYSTIIFNSYQLWFYYYRLRWTSLVNIEERPISTLNLLIAVTEEDSIIKVEMFKNIFRYHTKGGQLFHSSFLHQRRLYCTRHLLYLTL